MAAESEGVWVDLTFPVSASRGCQIAQDYAFMLARNVTRILPWWPAEPNAGVHPLKGLSACGRAWLIGGRTHLTLRVPEARVADCAPLAGQVIDLDGTIALGTPRTRPLLAHPVVYSSRVCTGSGDEGDFVAYIQNALGDMRIDDQIVVGRSGVLETDNGTIVGFSLLVAGLSPVDSLRVQQHGLGQHRSLGCGIFVPHRSINAVGL